MLVRTFRLIVEPQLSFTGNFLKPLMPYRLEELEGLFWSQYCVVNKVGVRLQCLELTGVPTLRAVGDPKLVCNPFWASLASIHGNMVMEGLNAYLQRQGNLSLKAGSATFRLVKMLGNSPPTHTSGTVP